MLKGGLRNNRRRFEQEDVNPMEGAINIVDAMLVFSCGLMLSLVIYWNIDIAPDAVAVTPEGEPEFKSEEFNTAGTSGDYSKVGTVYVDEKTGKMYMVEDAED